MNAMPARKRPTLMLSAVTMLVALMMTACIAPIEETAVPADAAPAADMSEMEPVASITLPDGPECLNAGEGATLAFDGVRVNYTCATTDIGDVVLLGDLASPMLDQLIVDVGLITRGDDGFILDSSTLLTMLMSEVTLADGTVCLNAGQGATLSFDGKRVNYNCETTDEGDVVLLGDFTADMTTLTVEKGLVVRGSAGFELSESEIVAVSEVVGVPAD